MHIEALRDLAGLSPLQRLVLIRAVKAELEAELKSVNAREAQAEQAALDFLADQEMDSVKIKPFRVGNWELSGATISKYQTRWARLTNSDDPAAFRALEAAGLGVYIQPKVNTHSLSAWFRKEVENNPDYDLPEGLKPHVTISSGFELRARKAQS